MSAESMAGYLRPYAQGTGIQYGIGDASLFPGVREHVGARLENVAEGELDFVIAGPSWLTSTDPYVLMAEWRRCLREGGRVALLVQGELGQANLAARVLAREVGLEMENPVPKENGRQLLLGLRSFRVGLRLATSCLSAEAGRLEKPDGWLAEFNFSIASVLLTASDGLSAAPFFQKVLEIEPDNVEALTGLGLSCAVQADWEAAEEALLRARELDPASGIAKEWLALCRRNLLHPTPPPKEGLPRPTTTTAP